MKIITLNREYGAGGHSVGITVAKRLGIEFYDRDILAALAKERGIDISDAKDVSEDISVTENILRAITPISYNPTEEIFEQQREFLLKIASKGSCVILGRCANVILREAGFDTLDVFIYADDAHRMNRVSELIGSDRLKDVLKEIRRKDYSRRNFYKSCTGHNWADCRDYHMMLDSGLLGYDRCIDLIVEAAKQ